jgi:hypothetical protein
MIGPKAMSDFTAKFFLDIYAPVACDFDDTPIHHDARIVNGIEMLVSRLTCMEPDTIVRHELLADRSRFLLATTGEIIAEIMLPKDTITDDWHGWE